MIKFINFRLLFIASVMIVFSIIGGNVFAGNLPVGVDQIITSVEGNIKYFVKTGDKVKKGTPLFFVRNSANTPSRFWSIQHKVDYYSLLYKRRADLVRNHAISKEDRDIALENLMNADDQMSQYLATVEQAFYVAPFDCEIVKLLYLQGSGISDGKPAIYIKCTDKNYQFIPTEVNTNMYDMVKYREKIMKERSKDLHLEYVKEDLGR